MNALLMLVVALKYALILKDPTIALVMMVMKNDSNIFVLVIMIHSM